VLELNRLWAGRVQRLTNVGRPSCGSWCPGGSATVTYMILDHPEAYGLLIVLDRPEQARGTIGRDPQTDCRARCRTNAGRRPGSRERTSHSWRCFQPACARVPLVVFALEALRKRSSSLGDAAAFGLGLLAARPFPFCCPTSHDRMARPRSWTGRRNIIRSRDVTNGISNLQGKSHSRHEAALCPATKVGRSPNAAVDWDGRMSRDADGDENLFGKIGMLEARARSWSNSRMLVWESGHGRLRAMLFREPGAPRSHRPEGGPTWVVTSKDTLR